MEVVSQVTAITVLQNKTQISYSLKRLSNQAVGSRRITMLLEKHLEHQEVLARRASTDRKS